VHVCQSAGRAVRCRKLPGMAGADVALNSKDQAFPSKILAGIELQRLHGGGVLVIEVNVVNKVMKFARRGATGC
jgi:hypothetical protein